MDGQIPECAPTSAPDNSAAPCEAVTNQPTADAAPFLSLLEPGVIFSAEQLQRLRTVSYTPAEEAALIAHATDRAVARGIPVRRQEPAARPAPPTLRVEDPISVRERLIIAIVAGLSISIVAGSIGAVVAKWFGWWQ